MPVATGLSKPPTMMPFTGSGGYVVGTPSTATRRPASESSRHTVGSRRSRLPTNATSYVPDTRRVKSKMPCFPGFVPVMNDDQAGNVTGGVVERSTPAAPRATSAASAGISPAASHGRAKSHVAPSRPMIAITGGSMHVPERSQALFAGGVDRRTHRLDRDRFGVPLQRGHVGAELAGGF